MVQRLSKLKYLILIPVLIFNDLSAGINLDELWQRTVKNNYSIMQQNKLLERAEKEVDIQHTAYLPKVSASAYGAWMFFQNPPAFFQGTKKDVSVNVLSLGINQPIFTGFRTKNTIEFAEHNFTAQALQKDIYHKKNIVFRNR